MPLHGLKSDLELAALVLTAGAASYFVSGQVLTNVMFTFLLASLFFLVGLHLDLRVFKAARQKWRQLAISLTAVYVLTPLVAYVFSYLPGSIGQAFLVIGVSAAALGSPKIWANLSNSDGDLASYTATFSLLLAPIMIPILVTLLPINLDGSLALRNLPIVAIPFLLGVITQNYENSVIQDMRIHFSKLAFWLIVLITLVQAKLLFQAEGTLYLSEIVVSSVFFVAFTIISFGYSHIGSRLAGLYEKEARSIGFIGSSRNIAIAYFIASQMSGEIVLLVSLYYFIRQITGLLITDMYRHGKPQFRKRVGF